MISTRVLKPSLLVAALLMVLATVAFVRPAAALHLTETTGTVLGYDDDTTLLSVNTRLGPKTFVVTTGTLILLNNHTANLNNIQPNDKVTVRYRFDTSVAATVHLFRERRVAGTVVAGSDEELDVRIKGGAVVTFELNDSSRVDLEGILLDDLSVLEGRRVTAIYEPGSFLLLSLKGESPRLAGRITAVDTAARTVTVSGRTPRTVTLGTAATLRRSGAVVPITSLVVGDRVTIAYVRSGTTLQGLALTARP